MKRLSIACLLLIPTLTACEGWSVQPLPYVSPTFYPSGTPLIYTATPIILPPPITATYTPTSLTPASPSVTVAASATYTITHTPLVATTGAPTDTGTSTPVPLAAVETDVLGCNTSFDVVHGMAEVTNAYITIRNTGNLELTDLCATLRGLDEGRAHPDKTRCIASLSPNFQVTEKLTIDTTYKQDTPIQVDITSSGLLLQRVGRDSCTDLGLLAPGIADLGTPQPIP